MQRKTDSRWWVLAGALLFAGGAWAQAGPPPGELLERYFSQGQQAIVENRYADASVALEKAVALAPGIPELNATLGFSYFQQGRFQQAIPVLQKAVRLKPGLPNVGVLLAASLSEMGRFTEALPGLEAAFPATTDPALKRLVGLQLERSYTGLGKDREAVGIALELTKLYPEDPEVLYHAGRLFGNFAYLSVSKLSQVAPDSVWASQAAGEAYESDGQYDRAVAEYRKVLEKDPQRRGIHFRVGRALLRGSQDPSSTGEAQAEFERELKLDPTNANAAYEIGEIYRKQGSLETSQKYFAQAVEFYPEFEQAQLALGGVLTSLGQPAEAVAHLEKAIALNDGNEVSYYRIAQAYRALGESEKMRSALQTFQSLRRSQQQRQAAGAANEPVTAQAVDSTSEQ